MLLIIVLFLRLHAWKDKCIEIADKRVERKGEEKIFGTNNAMKFERIVFLSLLALGFDKIDDRPVMMNQHTGSLIIIVMGNILMTYNQDSRNR